MKSSAAAAVLSLLLAATASAWDLTVYMSDGRSVKSHGTTNSGCVTYDFDMSSPVNRAVFHDSAFADTFELYTQEKCGGKVSYREGKGDHSMNARIIKSYKVY